MTATRFDWLPRLDPAALITSDFALRRLQAAYARAEGGARPLPPFAMTLLDGKRWRFGAAEPAFEVVVRDERGQAAIASLDEMRCCEAYMAGSIDIDGDLLALTG